MLKIAQKVSRFVGLDVHADTIAIAVAEGDAEARSVGVIPNRPESVSRLVKKLGAPHTWKVCYEAGPTGYVLYWQLTKLGVHCDVVAPTLVPVRAGDRVKTDSRDARKLASSYRAGELTPVWVPDAAHEALRDLVRAREAAKKDQLRARHRLGKFLLRHGRRPAGFKAWSQRYFDFVREHVKFDQPAQQATLADYLGEVDHLALRIERLDKTVDEAIEKAPEHMRQVIEALQALRGVAKLTAVTVVAEVGKLSRFESARQLMGYSGAVSREHSSGQKTYRGSITKTGNAHLRRVVVEAAWSQRHPPILSRKLRERQRDLPAEVQEIATKARKRLHSRYQRLAAKGKCKQQVITAVGRELLGFIWAIGVTVERAAQTITEKAAA
jgi:transposase